MPFSSRSDFEEFRTCVTSVCERRLITRFPTGTDREIKLYNRITRKRGQYSLVIQRECFRSTSTSFIDRMHAGEYPQAGPGLSCTGTLQYSHRGHTRVCLLYVLIHMILFTCLPIKQARGRSMHIYMRGCFIGFMCFGFCVML